MFDITPLVKLLAARRRAQLARMDAAAVQERVLLKLLRHAENTKFGKDHRFAEIKTIADFQARVKPRNWELMWDDYYKAAFPNFANVGWPGPTPYLALSSGTTSARTKYVPVTEAMNRSNSRAGLDLLAYHFAANPRSRLFDGKTFMLGGSTKLVPEGPGVWSGDLSGIAVKRMPFWARSYAFPKEEHALIGNWEEKADLMARMSLDEKIRALTGTPGWISGCSTACGAYAMRAAKRANRSIPISSSSSTAASISRRIATASSSYSPTSMSTCARYIRRARGSSRWPTAAMARG